MLSLVGKTRAVSLSVCPPVMVQEVVSIAFDRCFGKKAGCFLLLPIDIPNLPNEDL